MLVNRLDRPEGWAGAGRGRVASSVATDDEKTCLRVPRVVVDVVAGAVVVTATGEGTTAIATACFLRK